ncbi:MAG: hypothetical protein U5K43_14030 [Halofilum sp. (in: g-proteobacteria)]|nr:hypothetical protein [Halofilum sp. (in: g-proteobacteria)]
MPASGLVRALPAADVGHRGRHHRHERDVGLERQARHVEHGIRQVLDVHDRRPALL